MAPPQLLRLDSFPPSFSLEAVHLSVLLDFPGYSHCKSDLVNVAAFGCTAYGVAVDFDSLPGIQILQHMVTGINTSIQVTDLILFQF